MRGLLILVALAAIQAVAPTAAAQGPLLFRLLELKGAPVKWGEPTLGTGANVTYAFVDKVTVFSQARNCRTMQPVEVLLARSTIERAAFEAEVAKAFDIWAAVADIRFRRIVDAATADILIGAQARPVGRAFTNVAHSQSAAGKVRPIEQSLICLNPDQPWKIGFDGNLEVYDLRYTIAHEVGHAIGLDHPSASGQVMSYRYDERFQALQAGDVSGAVRLYGKSRTMPVGQNEIASATDKRSTSADDHQTRALP